MQSYEIESAKMQRRATQAVAFLVVGLAAIVAGYIWLVWKLTSQNPRAVAIGVAVVVILIAYIRFAGRARHGR